MIIQHEDMSKEAKWSKRPKPGIIEYCLDEILERLFFFVMRITQ